MDDEYAMLRERHDRLIQARRVAFQSACEAIMITERDGSIIDVNRAFETLSGWRREEVLGRNPRLLKSGRHDAEFYQTMWHALSEQGFWSGEIWNRRKDGSSFVANQTVSAVYDDDGVLLNYVALYSDISRIKEYQSRLEYLAHHDDLTGLPNRVLLRDRLEQAIMRARRTQHSVAVAYLDLDGFRQFNDALGKAAGDRLLQALAARMAEALRDNDTLARMGGDEFVVVIGDLEQAADCDPVLRRLLAAISEPVTLDEEALEISASLGVSLYVQGEQEHDGDALLRRAVQAMYQSKESGRNRYTLFDADRERAVRGRHDTQRRLREAMRSDEFELYYQPKVNMRTGAVMGVEALIRWRHPEHGLLPSGAFLPDISVHNLHNELGTWVINAAISQHLGWREQGVVIPVAVNVDAAQLQHRDFLGFLSTQISRHPTLREGMLELEVVESSALEDIAYVSSLIEACQDLGVQFALDDFGTGYSSLTYLKRLPARVLKIDQSFVRDMLEDPEDLAILDGVLGLAQSFARAAVAEGVETEALGRILIQLGCEVGQGYAIARPMPASEIPGWLRRWRPCASWARARPLAREDRHLLFGLVEHRSWVAAVMRALRGGAVESARLVSTCALEPRIRVWREAYEHEFPAVALLDHSHRRVHALAEKMLNHYAESGGKPPDDLSVAQLYAERDILLAQLEALAGAVSESH